MKINNLDRKNINESSGDSTDKIIDFLQRKGMIPEDASFREAKDIANELLDEIKDDIQDRNEDNAEAAGRAVADMKKGTKVEISVFDPEKDYDNSLVAMPEDPVWQKLDTLKEVNEQLVDRNDKFRYNLIIAGPAGTGKTDLVRAWSQENGIICFEIDAGSMNREDVAGLPYIDNEELIQKFAPASQFDALNNEKGMIVFFDEIIRAPGEVVSALMKMVEGHTVTDQRTKKGIKVLNFLFAVAAINPPEDKKGGRTRYDVVHEMDPAQQDRWGEMYKNYNADLFIGLLQKIADKNIKYYENKRQEYINGGNEEDAEEMYRRSLATKRIMSVFKALLKNKQFMPTEDLTLRGFRRILEEGPIRTNGIQDEVLDLFKTEIMRDRDLQSTDDRSKLFNQISKIIQQSTDIYPPELMDKYYTKVFDRKKKTPLTYMQKYRRDKGIEQ